MPNTVAQHAVATFTSPVNGTTPIDANTVRGNDNTTRTSYNNHDADPGIHLQSSTLASRPIAGTAGRKWMTADAGSIRIWHDNGTAWEEASYLSGGGGTISGSLLITGTLGVTGLITATGGVSGNVTGNLTGNASTATALATARNINGVSFNGTADITVTAAAGTLSGSTLASGVTASSLTSVGTLTALTVSGNLTVDTNTLFVDAANNRVGVNCTPVVPAQIRTQTNGNVGFQPATVLSGGNKINNFNDAASVAVGLELDASAHALLIAGTEALRVDGSRNLGLGVTPSAWASGFRAFQVALLGALWGSSTGTFLSHNNFNDGNNKYISNGTATRYYQLGGEHIWESAPSGTAGNAISFTQAMTLDASGRLGVGTPSPANKLSVIGKIAASDSDFTAGAYVHGNPASGADRQIAQFSVAGASNGFQVNWNHASSKIHIIVSNIPTASAGLPAGTLWSDAGTIKIA